MLPFGLNDADDDPGGAPRGWSTMSGSTVSDHLDAPRRGVTPDGAPVGVTSDGAAASVTSGGARASETADGTLTSLTPVPHGDDVEASRSPRVPQTWVSKALNRADAVWTVIRVLAPIGAFVLEGWAALLGAVLMQEGGLWLAGRLGGADQRALVRRLFLAAYALRVAIVLPTHYIAKLGDGMGALFRDDYTNDLIGQWLVRIARGDGGVAIFPGHQYLLSSVYSYLLMAIYAVFGYSPVLPKLLNISLAALCAVLVFDITRRIFNPHAAILAGAGAVVLPSFVVWSIATLKETSVLFASLLALWVVQFLATAPRRHGRLMDATVLLAALLVLLLDLRSSTAFIVVGLLGMVIVARSHVRLRPWQMALATLFTMCVLVGGLVTVRMRTSNRPLAATFEDIALQIRHRRAQEAAGAVSQLRAPTDVVSVTGSELPVAEQTSDAEPFSILTDVIDPLGYAALAPAPWQTHGLLERGASAEMPIWYMLLIGSFLCWRAAPRQPLFLACLAVYAIANWLILAAVEGNLGNLLRHRLTLDPVLLILGAAGLHWLWALAHLPDRQHRDPAHKQQPDEH